MRIAIGRVFCIEFDRWSLYVRIGRRELLLARGFSSWN